MAEKGFKRKLTAILSADVVGYSRLMRDDEEATVRDLASNRLLITEIIQKHHGRVVDSPGDNILAEFASVVDAVNGAIKIQEEIKKSNTGISEDRRMEFRIGINVGDVIEEEERIYGDGVNIAARVEGLAAGGGIAISGTVYEHIKDKLSLGYHYLGEQDVKNIPEPVRVYRLLTEPEEAGKMIEAEKPQARKRLYVTLGALALVILVAGGFAIWNYYFRIQIEPASLDKMAFPLPEKPSIAVLPLDNMSGDPDQDYIADGLTENIITGLSKISEIFVVARKSTFTYKGKPVKIRQVSEELGVRYVLEGSVQKADDRLRITAQLIDALEGHHLWAERYDRELRDMFALQDEITMKILTALEVKLTRGEMAREYETENLEAWGYAIKAFSLWERGTREDNAKARNLVEQALQLDPDYTFALLVLGRTYIMEARMRWSKSPGESIQKAFTLAQKAVALRETECLGHKLLATVYHIQRQHDMAIAEGERAIALGPNDAEAHAVLAYTSLYAGRFEDSIVHIKKAMRLSPYYPAIYPMILADSYFMAGRYDESTAVNKQVLERARNGELPIYIPHMGLAANYMLLGRDEEARFHTAELLKTNPSYSLESLANRNPYKDPAHLERWLDPLRMAGLPEHPPLKLPDKPSIAVLPFDNLSKDPNQDYFSDGITDQIITSISKIPAIFIIARKSSFAYKNKSIKVQQIAKELGVRYVLEGSIQRYKDQVRINVQLVDALSGKHIWAEDYDRKFEDIFAIQDEITMEIMAALQIQLTVGLRADLKYDVTKNLEAYEKSLKARYHYYRRTIEDVRLGQQFAQEAIDIDPNYAAAYRMMGFLYLDEVWFGMTKSTAKSIERAEQMAQKAISLRGYKANDYLLLSSINILKNNFDEAIEYGEKAVELGPNNSNGYFMYGMALRFAGQYKEAISKFKKAIRLNPIKPIYLLNNLGWTYLQAKEYESTIVVFNEAIQRNPDYLFAYMGLSAAYNLSGDKKKSHWAAENVLRINPKFSLVYYEKRLPIKIAEDKNRIINAMRNAGLK
ncbi:MAG: tetratricopeptide repeat protein [Desulfobacterales bacterium]|jgi:adenylate cyclase